MRQRALNFASLYISFWVVLAGCTVANPNRHRDAAVDGPVDAPVDGPVVPKCIANQALRCDDTNLVSCTADGTGEASEACPFGCNPDEKRCASKPGPVCTANQALRCDGMNLVRCNASGSGEASPKPCSLGCDAANKRCYDMDPSNGLRTFLAQASSQPDINLGDSATINTDTGDVVVGGSPIAVKSDTLVQSGAPTIRALIMGSLTAKNVVVTGTNAIAIVSSDKIIITGTFTASGYINASGRRAPGPGAFNDGGCKGGFGGSVNAGVGGGGGGGFGSPGGSGGYGNNLSGTAPGGTGGTVTGNAWLVPLRGGCDGSSSNGGGGAIQFVSGTRITVTGVIAANGNNGGGGGSGGGILLEAPFVEVPGRVIANGGSGVGIGANFGTEESARLDAMPAHGGAALDNGAVLFGAGGNGGAGNFGATGGQSISGTNIVNGGHGGGGYGRIRVNTMSGGHTEGGIYSPTPTFGTIGTR